MTVEILTWCLECMEGQDQVPRVSGSASQGWRRILSGTLIPGSPVNLLQDRNYLCQQILHINNALHIPVILIFIFFSMRVFIYLRILVAPFRTCSSSMESTITAASPDTHITNQLGQPSNYNILLVPMSLEAPSGTLNFSFKEKVK